MMEGTNEAFADDSVETADIQRIQELIPHRYPFLLIDRVEGMERGRRAIGIKNVSINEPFFQGHFPEKPVMPGVLVIEAMAQTAAALIAHAEKIDMEGKVVLFVSLDNARFRRPVEPGDRLELHVELLRARGNLWKFKGIGRVGDEIAAESEYAAMVVEI